MTGKMQYDRTDMLPGRPASSTMLEANTFSKKHYIGGLHAAAEAEWIVQLVRNDRV